MSRSIQVPEFVPFCMYDVEKIRNHRDWQMLEHVWNLLSEQEINILILP